MIFLASKIDLVGAFPSSDDSSANLFPGVFFFTLALFGFSCLSSLGLFANERILFMRERSVATSLSYQLYLTTNVFRANGYYSSFTYFSSKVCSIILLHNELVVELSVPGSFRHSPVASRTSSSLWGYCLPTRRPRAHGCWVLEVPPDACAIQPYHC